MANENVSLFELLKTNEKRRAILKDLIEQIRTTTPALCFAARPLREGDYWQTIDQKRSKTGYVPMIDLPTDLGLKEQVVSLLQAEYDRLQAEFDSYTIQK